MNIDNPERSSWIGVDLDGTLAEYEPPFQAGRIGAPVPAMVNRVKAWLAAGEAVRIVTARVSYGMPKHERWKAEWVIEQWCRTHIGEVLPIQSHKDFGMKELWDDRAVTVEKNTGRKLTMPLE